MATQKQLLSLRDAIVKGIPRDQVLQELDYYYIRESPNIIPPFLPETVRHPKSQRFHEILHELGALHDKKQRDYGNDNDPFANVTASTDWGIKPHVGALLRMNDKVQRLKQWIKTGTLANEGAHDSLRDIAVYAIIALVLDETENPVDKYAHINEVVPSNI